MIARAQNEPVGREAHRSGPRAGTTRDVVMNLLLAADIECRSLWRSNQLQVPVAATSARRTERAEEDRRDWTDLRAHRHEELPQWDVI